MLVVVSVAIPADGPGSRAAPGSDRPGSVQPVTDELTTTGGPTSWGPRDPFVTEVASAGRSVPAGDQPLLVAELGSMVARDNVIQMLQPDRWKEGREDPSPHQPGDVPVLRGIIAGSLLAPVLQGAGRTASSDGLVIAAVQRLYEAEPYFVPAGDGSAAAVLESDPPGPEDLADLRLGHDHVTVWFGDDLRVPDDLAVWPPAPSVGETRLWEATRGAGGRSLPHLLSQRSCSLTGVTISAGPDGTGISDWVDWLIAVPPEPGDPPPWDVDTIRGALVGRASRSTLGGLVATCAAAVAWGDWHPPAADDGNGPLPDPEDMAGREWSKRTRKAKFRKTTARGGWTGVRVIDLTAMHRNAPVAEEEPAAKHPPSGRTVSPHSRRGHWRRSRIGPRDAPVNYRRNWIAPTRVGGRSDTPSARVRVLPAPRPPR